MSLKERSGKRDLGFSQWHRDALGPEAAAFDIDLVATCNACRQPLIAYEATQQNDPKATSMLEAAARLMGAVPVFVRYQTALAGSTASTLTGLTAAVCGGETIGGPDALVAFELAVRDKHHALHHPDLPTFVYRKQGRHR